MILKPEIGGGLSIECYADADYAGLWDHELPDDLHYTRPRNGYGILVNKFPLLWTSKLQQLTTTSTMHAEYIALSNVCRDVIPLQELVEEISKDYQMTTEYTPTIKKTIYEDNEGLKTKEWKLI